MAGRGAGLSVSSGKSRGEAVHASGSPVASPSFELKVPGEHNVLNAAAALALCFHLWGQERPDQPPDWQAAAAPFRRSRGAGVGAK